ncbi:MAG TPA: hypothetical protein VNK23_04465 [Candidatus Dormibacteraeota bacterium]|nr:hypothetical protein [Candidatus Dormibacteraeota bacterium]
MSVKVKDGTPLYGPSLCETCCNAHVARGYRLNEKVLVCMATSPDRQVRFRVRECTSYVDKNRQTLYEMKEMAWILAPRGPKRRAGFVHSSELRNEDGDIELTLEGRE